jgi:hypothetical protein
MIHLEMMDDYLNQLWMQGKPARSLVNDLTDEAIRVPNLYDELDIPIGSGLSHHNISQSL